MSAKHTPGPWMPHHDKGRLYVETHRDDVICMVAKGLGTQEDQANANLIAAAPELLKVLRMARDNIAANLQVMVMGHTGPDGLIDDAEVVLLIEAEQDLVNQIDEVIAKATGEQA